MTECWGSGGGGNWRFRGVRHLFDAITMWLQFMAYWWQEQDVKNFHLPLPEQTYSRLRAEAERTQVPATALAREAVDLWLRHQLRKARHQAIAAYAEEMAGTNLDLDPVLESAGIEHLVKTGKEPQ
jgi:hypothetical protein